MLTYSTFHVDGYLYTFTCIQTVLSYCLQSIGEPVCYHQQTSVCQEGEYNTRVLKNECMWESLREVLHTGLLVKRTWSKSCIFSMLYVH